MASRTESLQDLVKTGVVSFFARRIANAIFQWDTRDGRAQLEDQTELLQREYERIGTAIAMQSDPAVSDAALYAAADAIVLQGLGPLTPQQRARAVAMFQRGLQAYRRHLEGTSDAGHREVMEAMAANGRALGLKRAPAPSQSGVDLATLESPVGVQ